MNSKTKSTNCKCRSKSCWNNAEAIFVGHSLLNHHITLIKLKAAISFSIYNVWMMQHGSAPWLLSTHGSRCHKIDLLRPLASGASVCRMSLMPQETTSNHLLKTDKQVVMLHIVVLNKYWVLINYFVLLFQLSYDICSL